MTIEQLLIAKIALGESLTPVEKIAYKEIIRTKLTYEKKLLELKNTEMLYGLDLDMNKYSIAKKSLEDIVTENHDIDFTAGLSPRKNISLKKVVP